MIDAFVLENCGPIEKVHWDTSPHINLLIGTNGTGKSMLLKMLYVALRSTEDYQRGNNTDSFRQIVGEKLRGTFQIGQIGDLVKNGKEELRLDCDLDDQNIHFSFSPTAVRDIDAVSENVTPRSAQTLFIPPKEVLSLTSIILRSRLQDQLHGFDDTYLDLTVALEGKPQQVDWAFSQIAADIPSATMASLTQARERLTGLFNGRLIQSNSGWQFQEGDVKHSIHITAEGIKRLALIDRLIGNRSLLPGSVLFIDEPEAMLHPQAIVEFMEILHLLADQGIQIFMASHSYFVLKSLYVIAKREDVNIQILSLVDGQAAVTANLSEGMPSSPIIDESITLYERELDAVL